ncbi:hypothetical protein ABZ901_05950 [Actinacidiphila alni]|uniref:hypothetical protein n=1 Tax=Actinacidiphila alni TaxID=380248 RepID=UPI0034009504
MRLSTTVHRLPGRSGPHRLVRPAFRLPGTLVSSPELTKYGCISGPRADLLRLAALLRFAALSPHTAVHIPLRHQLPVDGYQSFWFGCRPPLDLLFVRHDVGLRPSAWPRVRAAAGRGAPLAIRVPDGHAEPPPPYAWTHPRQVVLSERARTLIVAGPAWSLHRAADSLFASGERIPGDRSIHRHGESLLDDWNGMVRDDDPRPYPVEFTIHGRDPVFHKSRWAKESSVRRRPAEPRRRERPPHRAAVDVRKVKS